MDHDHYPYTDAPQHINHEEQLALHKNHSKLLIPLILLIVGVLVIGGLSFAYFRVGKQQCVYNGGTYSIGDSVPSEDGCNSCSCTYDEQTNTTQVSCTVMACANDQSDPATGWNTFQDENYTFKYPNEWQQQETNLFGSRSVTEFSYQSGTPFGFSNQGNYNQETGKEYSTLDEYLGKAAAEKSIDIQVAGNLAKFVDDPGDPGHVITFQRVVLFSTTKAEILDFYYQSSYYQQEYSENILTQILSTFRFLDFLDEEELDVRWRQYTDNELKITFEYPDTWSVGSDRPYPDFFYLLSIKGDELLDPIITVTSNENPEKLNPREWFENKRNNFHPVLMNELGEVSIGGYPAFIVGQPDTCDTALLMVAYVDRGHDMLTIDYTEYNNTSIFTSNHFAFYHFLSTLSFDGVAVGKNTVDSSFFQIPPAPEDYVCENSN
ncbi:MAG: hypothetical protein UU81_C0026G0022 [Microgenomates group bacterium GW2011_GWC1_41_8]|uniref:Uncharacterized protein n=2 Tax=Candidatus Roizmaniibacteriota TaxID=1752723 RepID=A0A0G0T551_9BACT|nr:MAG: hypothetical protein UU14_C0011G0023 [Candidatus Roizmanbacteria bacterium GW2011_GWB1_40_7]KKR94340.1 MAG: hypothetical protein UU41_C0008G0024 [Candidatus Roizmanbacteria bacterium GW2011_GWA1_41_13]KKS23551.1 MAG: hypothetical protein UU81_C0026G0022 [Microgenomates group bacterium GW2011_GWC1_41_8]OGK50264.1 MAG: hypothetical protein A3A55_01690 [Candidatus Roizmanbacteria bacterium RIFCSPLOWO2_01_FULL_40_14]